MRKLAVGVAVADRALRGDLAACVRAAGYAARELASTAELARGSELGVDAVLTDAGGARDLAAIASLRRDHPALRIIAIGDDAGHRIGVEARLRGADDFVRMPFDVGMLERALTAGEVGGEPLGDDAGFITADRRVERLLDRTARAAESEATILIHGESGTGKTTLAHWIHRRSPRRLGPLVTVSCAGLSGPSAESELFGSAREVGHINAARGGTLVLDDVGDLAPELQPQLLHALQERAIASAGSGPVGSTDIRVVATARGDLCEEVRAGRLREDLRLRLGVIELEIPPLRERPADIDLLAGPMAERFARLQGSAPPQLGEAVLGVLRDQPLKGNVWELQSLMRRAAMLFAGLAVDPAVLLSSRPPAPVVSGMPPTMNLKQLEREAIAQCLVRSGGNRTRASRDLGISVRTLRNKIRQYGLA